MNLKIHKPLHTISGKLSLPGSKSISNRILVIKALSGLDFSIENRSDSDDTKHLAEALNNYPSSSIIDVGHAGTDMRFLTAFLSLQARHHELTGSERLQQRPVKDLVDVLQTLGADITYIVNVGYPPLLIKGKPLEGGKVEISGGVSSQFITALLLVAPYFTKGLELWINGDLVSKPYVSMTVELMREFGASVSWNDNLMSVQPIPYTYSKKEFVVESDWSAASYYYSMVALSPTGTSLTIGNLFQKSLQADAVCAAIYKNFGVDTHYLNQEICITKTQTAAKPLFTYDFMECPDITQTLVCTCVGLKQGFHFTGLQTLKVKETDRIIALQIESRKLGVELAVTENSIRWDGEFKNIPSNPVSIATYQDHRMAMSFAALSLVKEIEIEDTDVVSKSYPLFWAHLKRVGIGVS